MGTGGSPTQTRNRNTRQVPDIRTNEGIQNFDPVGWQKALQSLQAQGQVNNPLAQFDANFSDLTQTQQPQSYVRGNTDINQILGQPEQQGYNTPQQNYPVQRQGGQSGVAISGDNNFNPAIQLVLKNEGGYTRFSKNLGGETNFGIIENTFNSAKNRGYIKSPDVRRLTRDDAIKIYRTDFWKQSRADQMPDALAGIYFDAYIQRPTAGGEVLQRAINRFAGQNLVKVDRSVGPQTVNAVNSLIRNNDDLRRFINIFCDERAARYRRVNGNKKDEKHLLAGYLRRNETCRKWALSRVGGNSEPAQYQQPQQAPAPQVTPEPDNSGINFSHDYLQDVPQPKTYGIYPNYVDYIRY